MFRSKPNSHFPFLLLILFAAFLNSCTPKSPKYKNIVVKFNGEVTDYFLPELKLSEVQVAIIQNNTVLFTQNTSKGKYLIEHKMDISQPFYIQFSKPSYLSKTVRIAFHEDSLQKIKIWPDTILLFESLSMELPFAAPFFTKLSPPLVLAEFFMANKTPTLNALLAKKAKKTLQAHLSLHTGEQPYFYKNGQPKATLNLINGQLNGECIWWDENGTVLKKALFANGKKQN